MSRKPLFRIPPDETTHSRNYRRRLIEEFLLTILLLVIGFGLVAIGIWLI